MTVVVTPLSDVVMGRLGMRLWIAVGLSAAVLLFGCGNVASIRVAQSRERATELAARLFLGSSRSRLAIDLATEAIPIVLIAAALAAVGWWSVIQLLSAAPAIAPAALRFPIAPHLLRRSSR